MAWVAAHEPPPGGSRQTASLVPWAASASHPPAGPGASVAVPGGSLGSARQGPVAATVAARLPFSTIATVPPGADDADVSLAPCSGSG